MRMRPVSVSSAGTRRDCEAVPSLVTTISQILSRILSRIFQANRAVGRLGN